MSKKREVDMQWQRLRLTYDCIGGPLFRCTATTCSHAATCYHKAGSATDQFNGDNNQPETIDHCMEENKLTGKF